MFLSQLCFYRHPLSTLLPCTLTRKCDEAKPNLLSHSLAFGWETGDDTNSDTPVFAQHICLHNIKHCRCIRERPPTWTSFSMVVRLRAGRREISETMNVRKRSSYNSLPL